MSLIHIILHNKLSLIILIYHHEPINSHLYQFKFKKILLKRIHGNFVARDVECGHSTQPLKFSWQVKECLGTEFSLSSVKVENTFKYLFQLQNTVFDQNFL